MNIFRTIALQQYVNYWGTMIFIRVNDELNKGITAAWDGSFRTTVVRKPDVGF